MRGFAGFLKTRRLQLGYLQVGDAVKAAFVGFDNQLKNDPGVNECEIEALKRNLARSKDWLTLQERSEVAPQPSSDPTKLLMLAHIYKLDYERLLDFLNDPDEDFAILCEDPPFNEDASWIDLLDVKKVDILGVSTVLGLGEKEAISLFRMLARVEKAAGFALTPAIIEALYLQWFRSKEMSSG